MITKGEISADLSEKENNGNLSTKHKNSNLN